VRANLKHSGKTEEKTMATDAINRSLGSLSILDGSGDTRMQWDRNDPAEVAKAEACFNELRDKGYLAYKVDSQGDRGEVLTAFDPAAERIILHSAMIGG
jgi:hypothetical protein